MAKIGMIGAGSWGTALTWLLTNNGHQVTVWSALENEIEMLKREREQKEKLPGVILSEDTVFTARLPKQWKDRTFWCSRCRLRYAQYGRAAEGAGEGRADHRQCGEGN